jgi:hypothetical protein
MERGGGSPECSGCAAGEDAPFRSPALAQRVAQHHLWHGDLLADGASFAAFRAWLEERLPRVTQTGEGYFTAALVRAYSAAVSCCTAPRALRAALRAPAPLRRAPRVGDAPLRRPGRAQGPRGACAGR